MVVYELCAKVNAKVADTNSCGGGYQQINLFLIASAEGAKFKFSVVNVVSHIKAFQKIQAWNYARLLNILSTSPYSSASFAVI